MVTHGVGTQLVSPKQPPGRRNRDWYPYYAGFTEKFALSVLSRFLADSKLILDPWSGSGTTTAACIKHGVFSKGVDINPAATIVARGRLARKPQESTFHSLLSDILAAATAESPAPKSNDPLETWMRSSSAQRIRAIQRAIHIVLSDTDCDPLPMNLPGDTDKLSPLLCFFYTVLFSVVRDLLRRFRPSNPMWLKRPRSSRHRIAPSWARISLSFRNQAESLAVRLFVSDNGDTDYDTHSCLLTGTATDLPFADDSFDGALTSPPYATRVDYVNGTLPELATLGADGSFIRALRKATIGSPIVGNSNTTKSGSISSGVGISALAHIASHSSKGSQSYYHPWMKRYLVSLEKGIKELDRTVSQKSPVCLVVQDSTYKGFLIDMQSIIVEMFQSRNRKLMGRYDYTAPNPRSRRSDRGGVEDSYGSTESLLVFG